MCASVLLTGSFLHAGHSQALQVGRRLAEAFNASSTEPPTAGGGTTPIARLAPPPPVVLDAPSMAAEDFAMYGEKVCVHVCVTACVCVHVVVCV